tara:strand:- start:129 stop:731 length:603 start_codon:yes stop_codon:yes gene_type:complete
MSSIKLKHASGNSMSLAAPATNPASDLSLKLPATVGTAGQVLQNSSTAGTLEFANGGKILQVVVGTHSTEVSTTSSSYIDTGLSQAITPLRTGSSMYVLIHQHVYAYRHDDGQGFALKLFQDSTARYTPATTYENYFSSDVVQQSLRTRWSLASLHSHGISAGTSTTYKVQMTLHQPSESGQLIAQQGGATSMITIMEVG